MADSSVAEGRLILRVHCAENRVRSKARQALAKKGTPSAELHRVDVDFVSGLRAVALGVGDDCGKGSGSSSRRGPLTVPPAKLRPTVESVFVPVVLHE